MIITVFVTGDGEKDQWCAELLEHSWQRAGQPGELVRLFAAQASQSLPVQGMARVIRTSPWSNHPYIRDKFTGYDKPAALLEWLMHEPVDATVLLLDVESILLGPIDQEVKPGEAVGNTWKSIPRGEGPFGLTREYRNLQAYCVNRELKLPKVEMPLLVHSTDLRRLAARWLELTGIIRCEVHTASGQNIKADRTAYTIAAAEYRIAHTARKMAVAPGDTRADRAVLNYHVPIESPEGKIVWDCETYEPWTIPSPKHAAPGAGRKLLAFLEDYSSLRESGDHLTYRRPRRRLGVREARVLDSISLEIPGETEPLNLNSSAASIWKLCDGKRTVAEIVEELEKQFEVSHTLLCADVDHAINRLCAGGAMDLEGVAR